jgi:hypothetical protein
VFGPSPRPDDLPGRISYDHPDAAPAGSQIRSIASVVTGAAALAPDGVEEVLVRAAQVQLLGQIE